MTNHWIDIKNSDCILIMGSNAAANHPISFKWIYRAMEAGATLISVDPRYNRTASQADVYARVHAGLEPICAKTCPTGAIKFGNERTIVGVAKKRLAEINRKQWNTGMLINADAVRAIYLVAGDPDDYYEYSSY